MKKILTQFREQGYSEKLRDRARAYDYRHPMWSSLADAEDVELFRSLTQADH